MTTHNHMILRYIFPASLLRVIALDNPVRPFIIIPTHSLQ